MKGSKKRTADLVPQQRISDGDTSGLRCKISPSGFPLSAFCLVLSAGLYAGHTTTMRYFPTNNETTMKDILRSFQHLVMIFTGMFAIASTSLKRKEWCTFIGNISRVGRTLSSWDSRKAILKRRVILSVYSTLFSGSLGAVIYVRYTRGLADGPVIGFVLNSYVRFVTWTYLTYFTISVVSLQEHLRLFNEQVERLSIPTNAFGKLYCLRKGQKFIQSKVLLDEAQVDWTRTLASLHEDLFQSFKALTAAFSLVAVPFVFMVFSDVVTLSFVFVVGVRILLLPTDYLVVVITFVLICFINLTIITVCCDSATREFNSTPKSVHKAYNNVRDVHMKKELLQFSKILLTRKPSFYAAGLFSIDISLQYKILAAVSTYLVILTQFQMQDKRRV